MKRKLETEKDYVFDKRLRYSVRQNESNCRFRDIVVRKEEGFTHILLSSQTSDNNALTPEVRALGRWVISDLLLGLGTPCTCLSIISVEVWGVSKMSGGGHSLG